MGWLDDWFGTQDEKKKVIFISFSMKDVKYRDHIIEQMRNPKSPFEFIDMSVKQKYKESEWKKKCRTRIKRSDGVIVLLSKNSWRSKGLRWEVKCAREEKVKILPIHIYKDKDKRGGIPPELERKRAYNWKWETIEKFLSRT